MLRLCIDKAPSAASVPRTWTTPLSLALHQAGYRLTEPRLAVVRLIEAQDGHFSAADLVHEARVRHLGVGRATIFRTLDVLVRARARSSGSTFRAASTPMSGCAPTHHHHVVCSRCGRTAEIEDAGLRAVVREVTRRTGFRVDEHRLELFGLCSACQAATAG